MKIGIYSGSFNPIHLGHIILGSYLVDFCDIDQVWYLVSPQNPLKESTDLIDENLRLEMAKLALKDYDNLKASDFEFDLEKPSYTYKTLDRLSSKYPQHKFHLIIGADNWANFRNWKNADYILSHYPIIVFKRLGFEATPHPIQKGQTVLFPNSPIMEVSSTFIRKILSSNKDARPYLANSVSNFITEHKLYKNSKKIKS